MAAYERFVARAHEIDLVARLESTTGIYVLPTLPTSTLVPVVDRHAYNLLNPLLLDAAAHADGKEGVLFANGRFADLVIMCQPAGYATPPTSQSSNMILTEFAQQKNRVCSSPLHNYPHIPAGGCAAS